MVRTVLRNQGVPVFALLRDALQYVASLLLHTAAPTCGADALATMMWNDDDDDDDDGGDDKCGVERCSSSSSGGGVRRVVQLLSQVQAAVQPCRSHTTVSFPSSSSSSNNNNSNNSNSSTDSRGKSDQSKDCSTTTTTTTSSALSKATAADTGDRHSDNEQEAQHRHAPTRLPHLTVPQVCRHIETMLGEHVSTADVASLLKAMLFAHKPGACPHQPLRVALTLTHLQYLLRVACVFLDCALFTFPR